MSTLSTTSIQERDRRIARGRLLRRLYAIAGALLVTAATVYGESWLLEEPSTAAMQCAVTVGVARAIDAEFAAN